MAENGRDMKRTTLHDKLTAAQHRALVALLSHATITDAARACGSGERTIRRWLSESEEFRREYLQRTATAADAATARLRNASDMAVDVLIGLMGEHVAESVRLRAALSVLELGQRDTTDAPTRKQLDWKAEVMQRIERQQQRASAALARKLGVSDGA